MEKKKSTKSSNKATQSGRPATKQNFGRAVSLKANVGKKKKSVNSLSTKAGGSGKDKKEEIEFRPHIRIKVKAYDHRIIDEAVKTIIETVKRSGATIVGPVPLPTEKKKQTVLRASFVHKNSREQYEVRIHKRLIEILNPPPKTIEALTTLSLPAGIDIEIKI